MNKHSGNVAIMRTSANIYTTNDCLSRDLCPFILPTIFREGKQVRQSRSKWHPIWNHWWFGIFFLFCQGLTYLISYGAHIITFRTFRATHTIGRSTTNFFSIYSTICKLFRKYIFFISAQKKIWFRSKNLDITHPDFQVSVSDRN